MFATLAPMCRVDERIYSAAAARAEAFEMTPGMMRAGVGAYLRWNPHEEDIESLVAAIYYEMLEARGPAFTQIPDVARLPAR